MSFRCGKCQAEIQSPDATPGQQVFCPHCGAANVVPAAMPSQQPNPAPYGGYAANPYGYGAPGYGAAGGPLGYQSNQFAAGPSQNGMAIAGFVLSFLFPLAGLIVSWLALRGMKTHGNYEGKSLATAGLIISIVWVALGCLWIIFVVGIMATFGASG